MKANCFTGIHESVMPVSIKQLQMTGIKSMVSGIKSEITPWISDGETPEQVGSWNADFLMTAGMLPTIVIDMPLPTIRLDAYFHMVKLIQFFSTTDCPFVTLVGSPKMKTIKLTPRDSTSYPYELVEQEYDLETHIHTSKQRNVSVAYAQKVHGNHVVPIIYGFWNFITNEFFSTFDEEYLSQAIDAIKKHPLYNVHTQINLDNIIPEAKMGIEQEWLFIKDEKVTPAHEAYLDWIDDNFGLDKQCKENLLHNGRGVMNDLFTHTKMGTDSRRILGESRSDPFDVNVGKEHEFNRTQILNMYKMLLGHYQKISDMGYDMRIGGGTDGESISSHFTFSGFKPTGDLIRLWSKYVVELLQKMEGGERPKHINPADKFTLESGERARNHYGKIDYQEPFADDTVRIKTEGNDGFNGFEFRPAPACFLNKTFTINIIQTLLYFLQNDTKDFEMKNPHSLSNWAKSFENFQPAWEFYYSVSALSLLASPLDYNLPSRKERIMNKINLHCSNDGDIAGENVSYADIRYQLMDYVHYPIFIKLIENVKHTVVRVPAKYKRDMAMLFQVFDVDEKIILESITENTDTEWFVLEGSNLSSETIFILFKIMCLVNHSS